MAGILGMVAGIGISSLVFHRTDPAPQVVATGTPATIESAVIEPQLIEADTVPLSPDLAAFSLTGEDVAEDSGNAFEQTVAERDGGEQSGADEFTIASVPLY